MCCRCSVMLTLRDPLIRASNKPEFEKEINGGRNAYYFNFVARSLLFPQSSFKQHEETYRAAFDIMVRTDEISISQKLSRLLDNLDRINCRHGRSRIRTWNRRWYYWCLQRLGRCPESKKLVWTEKPEKSGRERQQTFLFSLSSVFFETSCG